MGYKYFIGLKKRGMHSRWLHGLFYGRFRAGWKWSNALRYICRLLDGTIFLPSAHFMSLERREIWAIRRTFWINLASFFQRPIQSYSFLCFVLVWCCKAKIVAGRIVKAVRPAFLKRRANRKKSNLSFFRFFRGCNFSMETKWTTHSFLFFFFSQPGINTSRLARRGVELINVLSRRKAKEGFQGSLLNFSPPFFDFLKSMIALKCCHALWLLMEN